MCGTSTRAAVVMAFLLTIGATVPAASEDVKLECLTCHGELAGRIRSSEYVHGPVAVNSCASCHSPHASKYHNLLRKPDLDLCLSCHPQQKSEQSDVSVHEPFESGECTMCHDPHASDYAHYLEESPSKACFSCHDTLKKNITEDLSIHLPASAGECLVCHAPHSSPNPTLLNLPGGSLCVQCHTPDDETFAGAHDGYPVQEASCASCHAPHSSVQTKLLRPVIHVPVVAMMCGFCHVKDETTQNAFALAKDKGELCYDCHGDAIDAMREKSTVHLPVESGACLSCHSAHGTEREHLVIGSDREVCLSCHVSLGRELQDDSNFVHTPVREFSCTSCHAPHSSDTPELLPKPDLDTLCISCHPKTRSHTHPVGPEYTDPRTDEIMTCGSCHDPHASPFRYSLHYDGKRDLCVQCHDI